MKLKFLRWLISLTILAAILWKFDWREFKQVLLGSDVRFLPLALLFLFQSTFFQGIRLFYIFKGNGKPGSFWEIQDANFTALAFDVVSFGQIGSDIYRAGILKKECTVPETMGIILSNRLMGMVVNLIWILIFSIPVLGFVPGIFFNLGAFLCMLALILMVRLRWRPIEWLQLPLQILLLNFDYKPWLAGFLFTLNAMVFNYFLGRMVGVEGGFLPYILGIPLVLLATSMPFTIQGRGLVELAFLLVWGPLGNSKEKLIALVALMQVLAWLQSFLAGGRFLLKNINLRYK